MFKIGKLIMPNRVILAPMAGVSDKAFRMIAQEWGCGLVFTEMINDHGVLYKQKRTLRLADTQGEKGPVGVQIFGKDPEIMAQAAHILVEQGAALIDINFGCPTPKVVKNGAGSALLLDLPRCRAIIKAVAAAVQAPVTVKMRRGWEDQSLVCVELAGIAEQEGAQAVTIHPRSRQQFFSGQANWQIIKLVKKQVRIPVIGNGDVDSKEAALRMLDTTGCDAVMIGRAALGNPFIFQEILAYIEHGTESLDLSHDMRMQVAERHLELVCLFKGESVGVREMRKHISWYIKGMPGAAKKRAAVNQAETKLDLLKLIRLL